MIEELVREERMEPSTSSTAKEMLVRMLGEGTDATVQSGS